MIKQTIVALILSVGASSVFAAGTVKVFSNGSSEAKTLTGAEHLIDLVGQPRLANSWWPGAVISEELATAAALRQQQALLTRLAEQGADSSSRPMPLRLTPFTPANSGVESDGQAKNQS